MIMERPRFARVILIYAIIHFMEGMLFVLLLSRSVRVEHPIQAALLWPLYLLTLSILGGIGAVLGAGLVVLVAALVCLGLSLFVDLLLSCLQKPRDTESPG
jgi:hypothetical protein